MALDIKIGNINEYNLLEELGRGSYGVVYKINLKNKPD